MTKPAWAADIDIDPTLASALVAAEFPRLAGTPIELLGIGWDNAAFLIDGHIVFRFPRRRSAAMLIEREAAILPHIADRVPLRISTPHYVGKPSQEYPWHFAGYERIAGQTGCAVPLSDEARKALAEPLARFLRALHAIEPGPLVAHGLPPDQLGRLNHERRMKGTHERLPVLVAAGVHDSPEAVAWLETHPPAPLAENKRTVVHGDLYARHVLLGANARPVGVIDWGDVHLGDPAVDIAVAHLMLPSSAHAAFRGTYGPIDERTWNAARYRALYHAILEIHYGLREGDENMREIGSAALQLIQSSIRSCAGQADE